MQCAEFAFFIGRNQVLGVAASALLPYILYMDDRRAKTNATVAAQHCKPDQPAYKVGAPAPLWGRLPFLEASIYLQLASMMLAVIGPGTFCGSGLCMHTCGSKQLHLILCDLSWEGICLSCIT